MFEFKEKTLFLTWSDYDENVFKYILNKFLKNKIIITQICKRLFVIILNYIFKKRLIKVNYYQNCQKVSVYFKNYLYSNFSFIDLIIYI